MFVDKTTLLRKRYRTAKIFKFCAIFCVFFCFLILVTFISVIAKNSITPLKSVQIFFDKELITFIETNLENKNVNNFFPKSIKYVLKKEQNAWVPAKYEFKKYVLYNIVTEKHLENDYKILKKYLEDKQHIKTGINWGFFTNSNSINAETAGIKSAIVGSFYVLLVFIIITIPVGILVGIYISEFLPQGKRKSALQINIQNLASIPSIIYGIIALNIFVNDFNFTRSSAFVGGLTLSMLILPMIVMITYNSTSMVQQGYKDSALALGLSNVQTTFRITLPLAMPRIITGILLAITRAAGETAPLIMVGMAFFSSNVPSSLFTQPATTLPLQIFLWTNDPQEAFIEYTSAAILLFIIFLTAINFIVHCIRNKLNKI